MRVNPEDDPPGSAYRFLLNLTQPPGGIVAAEPHWHVMVMSTTVDELADQGGIDVDEGWEPFAAGTQGSTPVIYLRKQAM